MQKIASINFFNDEDSSEKQLKLKIDNILFFREALVKRMSHLKIKVEAKRLIKGQLLEKRLNDKDINMMTIDRSSLYSKFLFQFSNFKIKNLIFLF